ncbi:hypothetical protein DFH08DRAFT_961857 [Mycena albidolilacea]|uniref:Uncharacterized protein n=1 Tax=Mycena albidolilacea TaxID=1033008 RepID=A0AAD7EQL3_9AGAR|nr:hypothetical protein DFH08DRAFT_961857 [Mycena albidolilacea]
MSNPSLSPRARLLAVLGFYVPLSTPITVSSPLGLVDWDASLKANSVFPEISPEAAEVKQPLLFVAFTGDCLSLPIFGDTTHAKYAKGKLTRKEIGAGHWGTESHAEELNEILHEWLRGLD